MGYARYIGRVGGLAVALGVGVAVATTPGVAWAGPSDTDSSNSSEFVVGFLVLVELLLVLQL